MPEVVCAKWGLGASWIDCTDRVRQLLKDGRTFYANPSDLRSDPVSGVRKQLELTFAGDPPTSVTLNEGDCVSKAVARVERLHAIVRQAQAGMEAMARVAEPLEVCLDDFHEAGSAARESMDAATGTARSQRGRRKRFDPIEDERLYTHVKASGLSAKEYAQKRTLNPRDVQRAMARVRARRSRTK